MKVVVGGSGRWVGGDQEVEVMDGFHLLPAVRPADCGGHPVRRRRWRLARVVKLVDRRSDRRLLRERHFAGRLWRTAASRGPIRSAA